MSRRGRLILNIAALHVGWTACVLGAARGFAAIGPTVVAGLLLTHLTFSPRRGRDAVVIGATVIVGVVADGFLLKLGFIAFDSGVIAGIVIPLWMMALWANFATSLNLTLAFLHRRHLLSALLGAVGGAVAYMGGVRLGALSMPHDMWMGGGVVAIEWALVTPIVIRLAAYVDALCGRRAPATQAVHVVEA